MQFILNGPDVPDELIQAHEEGRVVFFCGAGISVRAKLPLFAGLFQMACRGVCGQESEHLVEHWKKGGKIDQAFDWLEKYVGDRNRVREEIYRILMPDAYEENYEDTHRSLLELSRTRGEEKVTHLVTTNFDRLFEGIRNKLDYACPSFCAPCLPVPKPRMWDGLVYLHGLLPSQREDSAALDKLIVTSGDFGRAYLTERWAARFVVEMIQNYVVCFVGYSLSDPVMRYIMDAVDAEYQTVKKPRAYMFLSEKDRSSESANSLLLNRSLVMIEYKADERHSLLHDTIKRWASLYCKGRNGKEEIVITESARDPSMDTDDGYIGRMIWALSDKSGVCARLFAEMTNCPPVGWLDVFVKRSFLTSVHTEERKSIVPVDSSQQDVDPRRFWMQKWMLRLLGDPRMILFAVKNLNQMSMSFRRALEQRLYEICDKRTCGGSRNICDEAHEQMDAYSIRFWRLVAAGRIKARDCVVPHIGLLVNRLKLDSADKLVLSDVGECLSLTLVVEPNWKCRGRGDLSTKASELLSWDLDFACGHSGRMLINALREKFKGGYSELMELVELAIVRGLDSATYLEPRAECDFPIVYALSSVEEHSQCHEGTHQWRSLVDLLRDGWVELATNNPKRALAIFDHWRDSSHFVLRRMALFAAKRTDVVPADVWIEELLSDHAFMLWCVFAKREVCRLLAVTSSNLSEHQLLRLCEAIVKGPPPCVCLSIQNAISERDRMIWLRLAKLKESGCELPAIARLRLGELTRKYKWATLRNQREEFVVWSCATGDPDYEAERVFMKVPRECTELGKWLRSDANRDNSTWPEPEDDWGKACQEVPWLCLRALQEPIAQGCWNVKRWCQCLQAWRTTSLPDDVITKLEECIFKMPDEVFAELNGCVIDLIDGLAKKQSVNKCFLLRVAQRVLSRVYVDVRLANKECIGLEDVIAKAINHPVGRVATLLLDNGFPQMIHKDDGLDRDYEALFTEIAKTDGIAMRFGRVVLASRLVALYYAKQDWVEDYILPRFEWKRDADEAASMWCGFLWNKVIHPPLLNELKGSMFEMLNRLSTFQGDLQSRLGAFIVGMYIIGVDGFSRDDYGKMLSGLTLMALEGAGAELVEFMRSRREAGKADNRVSCENLWKSTVKTFVCELWPKDVSKTSDPIVKDFALLIVYAGENMQEAFSDLRWRLRPIEDHDYVFRALVATRCYESAPETSLDLAVKIAEKISWSGYGVQCFLNTLAESHPRFRNDSRFCLLQERVRQYEAGGER